MCCSVKNKRGDAMSNLEMAGIAILCAFGLAVIAVGVAVAPDLARYIKISRM
jgi:hypothetical protein